MQMEKSRSQEVQDRWYCNVHSALHAVMKRATVMNWEGLISIDRGCLVFYQKVQVFTSMKLQVDSFRKPDNVLTLNYS